MKRILACFLATVAIVFSFALCACDFFGLIPQTDTTLKDVFKKYSDMSTWNFAVDYTEIDGDDTYEEHYEYLGYNILNSYETDGVTYTDYLGYDEAKGIFYFYYDNGDNTYGVYDEDSEEFDEATAYLSLIDLSELENFAFTAEGDGYTANNARNAGDAVIGRYSGYYWKKLTVNISGGQITKLVGVMNDGYTMQFVLSKHGSVSFTLPSDLPGAGGTMEKQIYDAATFNKANLQDRMLENDGAIGLPSTGNVRALVIPVQFRGDTITSSQLEKLETAFNGTSSETGWESVKTYYQKASYGKLNLSFDIQPVYAAKNTSTYYERYTGTYTEGGHTFTRTGEEMILTEALGYYESRLDLSKYDNNGDGAIDAVYLIYSAPVDYRNADFYWAYVTWYYGSEQYDNLDAYYYLFAGFDFMDEDLKNQPGMKINAATYIHETGHLLGLDDYYDYDEKKGSNEGLGGADMMDFTVGDQNVYSKTMLGWLEPTIVNESTTVTIQSSTSSPSAILIPLNFNNSYFSEYLLIDLYTAQGLNALHASIKETLLYDGAAYGVRIYHVSSSIAGEPYNNDFGSFTDCNNSSSRFALIKLVEADGERKFASTGGYAAKSDLWQAGTSLSSVFPSYSRNDGKKVNFDITINSVSSSSASITVTFTD